MRVALVGGCCIAGLGLSLWVAAAAAVIVAAVEIYSGQQQATTFSSCDVIASLRFVNEQVGGCREGEGSEGTVCRGDYNRHLSRLPPQF